MSAVHPRFGRLLPAPVIEAVAGEFRERVTSIFPDRLAFAFLCGGFAKGYATDTHDIDMFVCLHGWDEAAVAALRRWYFELHGRLGLHADLEDPAEVVTMARLDQRLALVEHRHLATEVATYDEYEAVVWADMLAGHKIAKVGSMELLSRVERRCELLPQRWRGDLLGGADPARLDELWTLPLSLLCERMVRYHKERR